jgi:hypothetical protein
MKRQFVVTHTTRQTEILALLDSWVTNTSSVKMICPKKIAFPHIFLKTLHAFVLVC